MTQSSGSERIIPRLIQEELRDSFMDYSMSVIVQRALPDARDGLKPVHRRILYSMWEQGLRPDRDYKKCATVVGNVLGKYHPHGDSAVYDTLVRMVQEFSLRYPLIDGQGNFGSIDGDSAAAYRYTEARLAPIALELLTDIESDTVDFVPNFDGSLDEPVDLPVRLPNLLLNGSDGIAVGMATKIPPHNLRELVNATDHLILNPECDVEDLMELIEGPDFPTGGYIWGYEGIGDAYRTGRGLVEMRARVHVEEGSYGKQSLVVTELPYQVNKARIIGQIVKIVRSGRVDTIADVRDESDRDGIRLVIETKRDVNIQKLLETLFTKTQLRTTFGVIMLALVDGKPEQLNLKDALVCFVEHRLDVIRRRAAFELSRSEDRAHVLEGLLAALAHIDQVIKLIRASATPRIASETLQAELELTERQAEAILAMRLARLTGLERRKLEEELDDLRERIRELRLLVAEDSVRRDLLRGELAALAEQYGDMRRTEILDESLPFPLPFGEGGESSLVLITRRGYIKAQSVRDGAALTGAEALAERDGDFVKQAFLSRGASRLLLFTAGGNVFSKAVKDLPRGTRSSRGHKLSDLVDTGGEPVVSVVPVSESDGDQFLFMATRLGQVKRTPVSDFANVRGSGIKAIGVGSGDEVLSVSLTSGSSDVLLAARSGQTIRFPETEIRTMGRAARGVRGIELDAGDELVAALAPRRDSDLVVATAGGYAKRVPLTEFRPQGRAGKGTALLPERDTSGDLVGLLAMHPGDRIVCELASGATIVVDADRIPAKARRGASVRIREIAKIGGTVAAVHPLRAAPVVDGETTVESPGATPRLSDIPEMEDADAVLGQIESGQGEFDLDK